MGLFKKDPCAICEGKTGLMDKKIADGKICKECEAKLSPWFTDFKETPTLMVKMQIEVRERNKEFFKTMRFPIVLGDYGAVLINEDDKCFIAVNDLGEGLFETRKKITGLEDVVHLNPDVIFLEQVNDVELEIVELSEEETRMVDGEERSYDPPEYTYSYMFYLIIHTKVMYAQTIRIQLNDGAVQIRNVGRRAWTDPGRKLAAHLLDLPGLIVEDQERFYNNDELIDWFYHSPYEMPAMSYGFSCTISNWDDIRQYHYYLLLARQIEKLLLPEAE